MRLGTRPSKLAIAQARLVAELIGDCEIVALQTGGDRGAGPADKSRWVDTLERALADGEIDLAVHSAKDLPGELAPGLALLGAPARAAVADTLVGTDSLQALPPGAHVGTSSLRRLAQLRAAREDLELHELRGNVDTRLARLGDPESALDAIVLAQAGLDRLGLAPRPAAELAPESFVPAPGQGALALQGRAGDAAAREAATRVSDPETLSALLAERALARSLEASCHTPLGALARPLSERRLQLCAWVGLPDGSSWIRDELTGELEAPEELGARVGARMRAAGAAELLARSEQLLATAG